MEQQVSQRSIKKYMGFISGFSTVGMFRYFEGCRYGICVECHEKCEAAMDGSRAYTGGGIQYRGSDQSEERIEFIWISGEFQTGYEICLYRLFFSSITPSATGGQPVQLYVMNKDNIHVAHGTMALLTELTSFQIAAFLMENVATFWILTEGYV